jgi:hypothetical protein
MTWGPGSIDNQLFQFTELQNGAMINYTLPSTKAKPTNNFMLFKYFNQGGQDLLLNISNVN